LISVIARWLVPEFFKKAFSRAYTKSIYIFMYFVYSVDVAGFLSF
jgi:hypothetical protein